MANTTKKGITLNPYQHLSMVLLGYLEYIASTCTNLSLKPIRNTPICIYIILFGQHLQRNSPIVK
jgi:hypothetical protein